ncbi:UDP-glycosyltransferase UGT4-like, partial [Condylostylus longicornis]|uniref:UDP-glycosyltransferase UGT4-like n=1 Tax=Condylostylus longicornis TaxID=2530218 RepID=UPI00244E2BDC
MEKIIVKYICYIIILIIYNNNSNEYLCRAENMNILGIVTSTSISNHIHALALFDYLAATGNSVTVISPFSQTRRINHISLEDLLEENAKDKTPQQQFPNSNQNDLMNNKEIKYFNLYNKYKKGLERTATVVQHKNFTELIMIRRPPLFINLIILDYDYNEALIGLGAIYNCPVFILSKGEPRGLIDPLYMLSSTNSDNENWFDNISNAFDLMMEKFYVNYIYFKKHEKLFNQFNFHQKNLSFSKLLEQHLSKIFITSISIQNPFITITDNEDVTGFHINDRRQSYLQKSYINKFPETLENFIHSSNNGIIYVSFGNDFMRNISENQINKIIMVLKRRKEKIIWSCNGGENLKKNLLKSQLLQPITKFYISDWLPQTTIMEHSNIKLFLTNCGHLSLIESIYFEIPILGLPYTNDEKILCNNIINNWRIGEILYYENFTIYEMNKTIEYILDINSKFYMINVQNKSLQINDKIISTKKF